jgi:hypothetical protein
MTAIPVLASYHFVLMPYSEYYFKQGAGTFECHSLSFSAHHECNLI